MLVVHPHRAGRELIDRLWTTSAVAPGLKVSLFVTAGARHADVDAALDACWVARSHDASPTMLLAVLRHLRSTTADLIEFHRRVGIPPLACFALLDGSVHDDLWVELDRDPVTRAHVGPRFELAELSAARVRAEELVLA